MAKKDEAKDPIEKARRKLAQSQLKLHVAEDRHMQARARGKQEIEQARLKASKWLTKAAEDVEKRREQVARAEARLLTLSDEGELAREQGLVTPNGVNDNEAMILTLDEVDEEEAPTEILVPGSGGNGIAMLREREIRALQALYERFGDDAATVGQWRAAANMPETTFARARRSLVDQGLVLQDGDGGRATRYALTDVGASLIPAL